MSSARALHRGLLALLAAAGLAASPTNASAASGGAASSAAAETTNGALAEGSANDDPRANALVTLQAGVEAGSRHFSYVDRMTPALRPYDLPAAPILSIRAELYPLARTSIPVLRGLGLVGDYGRAVGLDSADGGGTRVGTSWQTYDVGLRERLRLGRALLLGVDVGYGANDFEFDQPSFAATLPTADYSFVRAGLDLRASFGAFSVFGAGSYLNVLEAGGMSALFPHESVGGIEAQLGAALLLSSHAELSLSLAYTRFFYSFQPVPGDANVAGGALDEMGRLALGFTYFL